MKLYEKISVIQNLEKLTEIRKYLKSLQTDFNQLNDSKSKNEYVETIKNFYIDYTRAFYFDESFRKEAYSLYNPDVSLKLIVIEQFGHITKISDVNKTIDEILSFLSYFTEKNKTKRILKKDIKQIFNSIEERYPEFKNILSRINLQILLFDNSHSELNSMCIPASNFLNYKICCLYLKNDDSKYLDPRYILVHELGDVICFLATMNYRMVPQSFEKVTTKIFPTLSLDNPDALEVFADNFTMAVLYNNDLKEANPFLFLNDAIFDVVETYFRKLIKNVSIELLGNE